MREAGAESATEVESGPLEQRADLGTRGYVVASAFVVLAVVLEVAWVAVLAFLLIAGVHGAGL